MSAFDLYQYGGSLFNVPDSDSEYRIPEKMKGYIPYLTFFRKMYTEKALKKVKASNLTCNYLKTIFYGI